jgi:hypothetical protein
MIDRRHASRRRRFNERRLPGSGCPHTETDWNM